MGPPKLRWPRAPRSLNPSLGGGKVRLHALCCHWLATSAAFTAKAAAWPTAQRRRKWAHADHSLHSEGEKSEYCIMKFLFLNVPYSRNLARAARSGVLLILLTSLAFCCALCSFLQFMFALRFMFINFKQNELRPVFRRLTSSATWHKWFGFQKIFKLGNRLRF